MPPIEVINNQQLSRFEVQQDGHIAELVYKLRGSHIELVHTGVPPEMEGRGVGSALAKAGLDHARVNGLLVIPTCPFVKGYLQRHPEYGDLVVIEE